jgi:hypothetical protein
MKASIEKKKSKDTSEDYEEDGFDDEAIEEDIPVNFDEDDYEDKQG